MKIKAFPVYVLNMRGTTANSDYHIHDTNYWQTTLHTCLLWGEAVSVEVNSTFGAFEFGFAPALSASHLNVVGCWIVLKFIVADVCGNKTIYSNSAILEGE